MRYGALVISLLIAGTASIVCAQQQPETVFGLQVAAPLTITECATEGWSKSAKVPETGACYERDDVQNSRGGFHRPTGKPGDEPMRILFAFKNRPAIAAGQIRAVLRGGKLASIIFTGGQPTQEADLKLLEEKYGDPTGLTRPSYQNGLGAQSEGIDAEWRLPSGAFVKLTSPYVTGVPGVGGPAVGLFTVQTAAMKAEQDADKKVDADEKTKL